MTRAESRPEVRRDPAAVSSDGAPNPQAGDEAPPRADPTALPGAAAAADAPEGTLPQLLKIAGAVLGSTTVLTGLLFYFGRLHITGFFRYFRVNFTVLDLTPNDYLVRSADGLFVPMTTAAIVGLLALWLNRLVLIGCGRIGDGRCSVSQSRRRQAWARCSSSWRSSNCSPDTGSSRVVRGWVVSPLPAASSCWHTPRTSRGPAGPQRTADAAGPTDVSALAEGGFAFVLVTIGLFWAVGSYAIDVGTESSAGDRRGPGGRP